MDDVKQIIPQLTVFIWLLVWLINVDLVFQFEPQLALFPNKTYHFYKWNFEFYLLGHFFSQKWRQIWKFSAVFGLHRAQRPAIKSPPGPGPKIVRAGPPGSPPVDHPNLNCQEVDVEIKVYNANLMASAINLMIEGSFAPIFPIKIDTWWLAINKNEGGFLKDFAFWRLYFRTAKYTVNNIFVDWILK